MMKNILSFFMPAVVKEFYGQVVKTRQTNETARKNFSKVKSLLAGGEPIKLEIGSGPERKIPGWTTADMCEGCDLVLDLAKPLPFPDNSVEKIYSSHVLEHFYFNDLMKLLSECRRVLKPSGVFSASVPNARIYIEAYARPESFEPAIYCRYAPAYNYNSKMDFLNYMAYMDGHHRYMFDEENIISILVKAGFKNPRLRSYDAVLDMPDRDFQSIYVQAEK
jgi:predicted SAM-dependent methyltransferase